MESPHFVHRSVDEGCFALIVAQALIWFAVRMGQSMVAMRDSSSMVRRLTPVASSLLVLLGAALLVFNAAGAAACFLTCHRAYARSPLARYVASLESGTPFVLKQATRELYLGTTHSDDRRIVITENWLQWVLGRIYAPLSRTQDTQRLLAEDLVNCSERSQILKTLAERSGLKCRFIGLSGHVVLEVKTERGWQIADPDYGVVFSASIAELEVPGGRHLVERTLAEAGHPPPAIEAYRTIVQSAENNMVLPVGSALSPRLFVVERCCQWLAWILPASCVLLGAVMRRSIRQRASLAASPIAAPSSRAISRAACGTAPQPRPA